MSAIHDKRKLIFAALPIVGLLLWAMVFKPALNTIATLNRVIPQKQQTIDELARKVDQYNRLSQAIDSVNHTSQGADAVELLSSIEQLAHQARLAENMSVSKRPGSPLNADYSKETIEIELAEVSMEQILTFIKSIGQSQDRFQLDNLQLTAADSGKLNAQVHISTLSRL